MASQFQKFKEFNSQTKQANIKVSELAKLAKLVPSLRKEIEQYSLHLSQIEEFLFEFNGIRKKMSEFEQSIATGYNSNGELADEDFTHELVQLLMNDDFDRNDKLRLIMLYLVNKNGILQKYISTFLMHSKIDDKKSEKSIVNLSKLGVQIIRTDTGNYFAYVNRFSFRL